MAGHSKFKNIMHRKGAQDRKKAQVFAKLGKEITVAAKMGGGDPASNARLRLAVQNARGERMPKENIERAIVKGVGGGDGVEYSEIRYEGYGPSGVAIIVEVMTDNKNRAAAEIRNLFNKNGGSMGETGSVSFMFDRLGEIIYPLTAGDHDLVFEAGLEAGADDVTSNDETHEIICSGDDLNKVATAMEEKLGEADKVGLTWRAQNQVLVEDDKVEGLFKLINALEDNDDVQNVYANEDISDEALAKLDDA
ncbi:MAG: YebC/PmpR family DNA-binding transcriptional regulator [Alphaproteobacteria bacterium]